MEIDRLPVGRLFIFYRPFWEKFFRVISDRRVDNGSYLMARWKIFEFLLTYIKRIRFVCTHKVNKKKKVH